MPNLLEQVDGVAGNALIKQPFMIAVQGDDAVVEIHGRVKEGLANILVVQFGKLGA